MPLFAFDVRQGCGCKESFLCRVDFAGFPYEMVPRKAFDEAKKKFRRRWCAKCHPEPPALPSRPRRARTSTRRAVRPADTGLDLELDPDVDYDQRSYDDGDGWPMS